MEVYWNADESIRERYTNHLTEIATLVVMYWSDEAQDWVPDPMSYRDQYFNDHP